MFPGLLIVLVGVLTILLREKMIDMSPLIRNPSPLKRKFSLWFNTAAAVVFILVGILMIFDLLPGR